MNALNKRELVVNCPQCDRLLAWDPHNAYRPFCSERCKLIDLGQWASGNYRVPADADQSSDDSEA
jgi:endogenous inhibitor of DNA gyrase (YacG/DUF329 family)